MSKLTFNSHEYNIEALVRLSGSFPLVAYAYADLQAAITAATRLQGLKYILVHPVDGQLRVMAVPQDYAFPKDVQPNTQLQCRLASKHHLKKCVIPAVMPGIFDNMFDLPEVAPPPPRAPAPPRHREERPVYPMHETRPGPNSAGGHQPNPNRAYPGNGIDIRRATPRPNSTGGRPPSR